MSEVTMGAKSGVSIGVCHHLLMKEMGGRRGEVHAARLGV